MWEFLQALFQNYGLAALILVVETAVIAYLFRLNQKNQEQHQKEIVEFYEKRITDVVESKEDYEELAHKLDQSIDILIKVFREKNGDESGG